MNRRRRAPKMLGAAAPGNVFDNVNIGRQMARPRDLRDTVHLVDGRYYDPRLDPRAPNGLKHGEASVFLDLIWYAGSDGYAYPSIAVLALDGGYKPKEVQREDGSIEYDGCSAISTILSDLQNEHQLIWSKGTGRGGPADRVILIDADQYIVDAPRRSVLKSGRTESRADCLSDLESVLTDSKQTAPKTVLSVNTEARTPPESVHMEAGVRAHGPESSRNISDRNGQMTASGETPSEAVRSPTSLNVVDADEDAETVRAAIRTSLEATGFRAV